MPSLGLLLLLSAVLVALNALFVLVEFALVRVRSSRIEVLARKGNLRARATQDILAHLDEYLAVMQVGITVVSLALGWIGEPALARLIEGGLMRLGLDLPRASVHTIAFGGGLLLLAWTHIVFGELIPRSIGIQRAEGVALWFAHPLRFTRLALRWPIALTSACSVALLHLAGFKSAADSEAVVGEDEMRVLLGETHEKGTFPFERLMLLENLFDLGQTKAQEAMTARDKIAYLSMERSWEENLQIVRARHFSRYPLCEKDLDSLIGFVHVKDILFKPEAGSPPNLHRLRRDLPEVREDEPLEKLLKSFPDKGIQMAVVRDSMGKVLGLITLEDILEELVGEIHDEYDLPQAWSLGALVSPQAAAIQLSAASPAEAITVLVERLCAAEPSLKRDEVLQAVLEREKKFSSAVGKGVAIPHARLSALEKPLIAVGRFAKPVPFSAPDGAPVRLVFLILTPAATPVVQLKVLGRIAALVSNENLRRKLLRAKSAETLLETLRTADTLLAA